MKPQPLAHVALLSITGLLEVCAGGLTLATLTGFLGRFWWVLELTSHFRPHLAVALATLTVFWMFKRRWRMATVCGVCTMINATLVFALLWPGGKTAASAGARLRLVTINVHTPNARTDLVLEFLRKVDADVILLMEVDERWMTALEPLRTQYPQVIAEPRQDNFGIVMFSRVASTNCAVIHLGNADLPSISATILIGGQGLFLLGTHSLPPGDAAYARMRNEQLREIAAELRRRSPPAILLGDLNTTPWSTHFAELLRSSGLRNSSQGRGLHGSWPAWMPWGRIPIDHCLVSSGLNVLSKWIGPNVGSDHLPVVIELQVPTP